MPATYPTIKITGGPWYGQDYTPVERALDALLRALADEAVCTDEPAAATVEIEGREFMVEVREI